MTAKKNTSLWEDGYTIVSYGGIGDELWEDRDREKPRHNLSASCHKLMIRIWGSVVSILIDVGAYQGRGKLERNMSEVAEWVSAIILTHPHMDHIGDFPKLFKKWESFEGRVFASPGTRQAAEIQLVDAAKILARVHEKKQDGYRKMMEELAAAQYAIGQESKIWRKGVARKNGNRVAETWSIQDRKAVLRQAEAKLTEYGVTAGDKDWKKKMEENVPEELPYTLEDVYTALSAIDVHTVKDGWHDLVPGQLAFRFYNAWHIIGSTHVLFRVTYKKKPTYILFSGDIGSYKWDIHPTGVATPPHNLPIHTVMVESTYGNRVRGDFEEGLSEWKKEVVNDLAKYRRIVIASFAMDRSQNILYRLIKMKKNWEIPEDIDIILDSPAAIAHTQAYIRQAEQLDDTIRGPKTASIRSLLSDNFEKKEESLLAEFAAYIDPKNGHYETATKENRETLLLDNGKPKIIVTSSGMADGGMVIEYLRNNISDPTNVFYFPGYLVPGSLWYALANESQPGWQQKLVRIEWEEFEVNARMKQFNFLSGHGDAEDLRAWLGALRLPKWANIMVVHGDVQGSSLEFKHGLERHGGYQDTNIIVPQIQEQHFFHFAQVSEKRSQPRMKSPLAPLEMKPVAPRERVVLPPQNRRRNRVESKVTWPTPAILSQALKSSEVKRYKDIITLAKSELVEFISDIITLPIPFLETIRAYYRNLDLLDEQEREKDNTNHELARLESSGQGKKDLYLENRARLERKIYKLEVSIGVLQAAIKTSKIKSPSAKELSLWILESLWYDARVIKTHNEIVPLKWEKEVDTVLIATIVRILKYEKDDTLSRDLLTIRKIKDVFIQEKWEYTEDEKVFLEAIEYMPRKSIFGRKVASLIARIDQEYTPKIPEDTLHTKKPALVKKPAPEKIEIPLPSVKGKKDNQKVAEELETRRNALLEEEGNFIQVYKEWIVALEKTIIRLEYIQRCLSKNPPETISSWSYKDISLGEAKVLLKEKRAEKERKEQELAKREVEDQELKENGKPSILKDDPKRLKEIRTELSSIAKQISRLNR